MGIEPPGHARALSPAHPARRPLSHSASGWGRRGADHDDSAVGNTIVPLHPDRGGSPACDALSHPAAAAITAMATRRSHGR
jgi:hypothetical protein